MRSRKGDAQPRTAWWDRGRPDGDDPEAGVEQLLLRQQSRLRVAENDRLDRRAGGAQRQLGVARGRPETGGQSEQPLAAPGLALGDVERLAGRGCDGLRQRGRVDVRARLLDEK